MGAPISELLLGLKIPQDLLLSSGVPTGITDLDGLTGGMHPGLWVVAGGHDVGVGMWLTCLAGRAALEHRVRTYLCSPRDDLRRLLARLLAADARVDLTYIEHRGLNDVEQQRLALAAARLAASPLTVQVLASSRPSMWIEMGESFKHRLVVINDAHTLDPDVTEWISPCDNGATVGATIVLGLPRERVLDGTRILAPWAAGANVVIDVERPDLRDAESPRAGEIDLHVLRNRHGKTGTVTAAFQPHYGRVVGFVEVPANQVDDPLASP